jgi:catalase
VKNNEECQLVKNFNRVKQGIIKRTHSLMVRKILLVSTMLLFAIVILYFSGIFNKHSVTAQRFVNLQEGAIPNAGFRRAHAKGICVGGTFESNGLLDRYSVANVFSKGSTPFLGRFSIAGNNPTAPDLKAPVRSLAFALLSEKNQEWRVAMNTPPVMAVATPEAFFEQLRSLSPDPVTKKRNPEKIKAFFAAHPESKAFNEWKASYISTHV